MIKEIRSSSPYLSAMRLHFASIALLLLTASTAFGQAPITKGRVFISWGWNRSAYTDSDIHFTGDDYDLTLSNVHATDRPTRVTLDYLNPVKLTIPQTNFRLGWFFRDHYSIALGFDHMKYVVVQDQVVQADGHIYHPNGEVTRYMDEPVTITSQFLTYEHTDGLNFIHLELARHDRLLNIDPLRMDVLLSEGIDAGVLMPRTASRFLGKPLNDAYHLSGYGTGLKLGLVLQFIDRFFVGMEVKGGFIAMPDVRTSNIKSDRASQHFWYKEGIVLFGASFRLHDPKVLTRPASGH